MIQTIANAMTDIEKNLKSIGAQIDSFAAEFGRNPNEIKLLAVSKTKPIQAIETAYQQGQRHFGENYLQEAEKKITQLQLPDLVWHFIGPIQSNKTRLISQLFDWAQTIDRKKIALRLNEQRPAHLDPLNTLIQVNISGEKSKSGVTTDEIQPLAQFIEKSPNLRFRGLMSIPAPEDDFDQQRASFAKLNSSFQSLKKEYKDCDTLSMGMSNDLRAAIAEGSTLVRIGTAIFGQRN